MVCIFLPLGENMKVLVLGWYGHNNCGDESYKLAIPKIFPAIQFKFVDKIGKEEMTALETSFDAVILGGGNVFKKDFLDMLETIKHKPIYGFSIGAEEPISSKVNFSHIYAREKESVATLKKMGVSCSFIPDASFILDGDTEKGKKSIKKYFENEKNDLYSKLVVVVVNSYLIKGGLDGLARDTATFSKFSYDLARAFDEISASFLFVPFGTKMPPDDRIANSWIASKCKYWKKNCVVFDRPDVQTTLDIISAADLVISTRLHSSIFAYNVGVPFIDITHHSKNKSFLDLINGNENSMSFWHLDGDLLKEKIKIGLQKNKNDKKSASFKNILKECSNAIHFGK